MSVLIFFIVRCLSEQHDEQKFALLFLVGFRFALAAFVALALDNPRIMP